MPEPRLTPGEILSAPYSRVVVPDPETKTFTARILEFPGCVAQGDSVEEAYERLQSAAKSWVEAALDLGQKIPDPLEEQIYSGRVLVRLPKSLHRQATEAARRDATSLNQFIVTAVAERVGVRAALAADEDGPVRAISGSSRR
jgi:predicted RNase H-like HicB family nuclease